MSADRVTERNVGQYYFEVENGEFVNRGRMTAEFYARGSERLQRFQGIFLNGPPVLAGLGAIALIVMKIIESR